MPSSSSTGDRRPVGKRLSAAASPRSVSTAGWMPRASSRSSSSASESSLAAPARASRRLRPGRSSSFDRARRSARESETRRCCAPSWRLRSSRRRASSPAATRRVREARSSSSWRLRSVTSSPPGDDADHLARLVVHRCAAPGDHAALAACVREDVLVLGRRELGRCGAEARLHRLALAVVDEHVPEVAAAHLPGIVEAARLDGRRIEVADPAVGVHR